MVEVSEMTAAEQFGFTDGQLPDGYVFAEDGAVEAVTMPASITREVERTGVLVGSRVA